jgi:hypothetical protein
VTSQYDWRTLVAMVADPDAAVCREVMRLRAQGRTAEDIAMLLGMNSADVTMLVFGPDEPGTGSV